MELGNAGEIAGNEGRRRQKLDHAIGVGVRERLEKHRVYHRKDGGVGSDSKGQGAHSGESKTRIAPQLAQSEARIFPKQFEVHLADSLFCHLQWFALVASHPTHSKLPRAMRRGEPGPCAPHPREKEGCFVILR